MTSDEFNTKVAFIVETDGLLKHYIDSVVIKKIKAKITDSGFRDLNSKHIHAAMMLKSIAPCSLKEFAATLRLSKSAASALVDRMVENNIVLRQPNPQNRREILLSVSAGFEEHVAYVKDELTHWFTDLAAEMGMDDFNKWHTVMVSLNSIIRKRIQSNHDSK